ncbi:MAG: RNA 2',3'-cyclic phosphodiesterase [FCB group bacterium]|nr:RNA 2',3'-cyclic phosphodiesterase [FCB group bacterium]
MTGENTKRTFIAINIPRAVGKLMPMITSVVKTPLAEIRWLSGFHLHLTLLFLGNIEADLIAVLSEKLRRINAGPRISASIEGTGIFPDEHHARILWLGMRNGSAELISLQKSITRAVADICPQNPRDSFKPHITIGRVRPKVKPERIDFIPFLNTVYNPIHFTINEFILYESILTPDGPRYTALEKFPLIQNSRKA